MHMKFKVLWTENAIQDLIAIKEFIPLDLQVCAETWIDEHNTLDKNLATFPRHGKLASEFKQALQMADS